MKNDFDKIIDRSNTNCYKWDYLKEVFNSDDVLPLWVADMDFAPPPEVIHAINNRAQHPVYGYSFSSPDYLSSFLDWQKNLFNWKIESEWLLKNPSIVTAFNLIIHTFTQKNDKVLIFTPVYTPFFDAIRRNERQLVTSSLVINQNRFEMNFDDLEAKLKNGVKMILFCSPHNPVGRVWEENELLKVISLCKKYDILMVSDEIHADLVFGNKRNIPIISLCPDFSNIISLHSPAKTFNIAGITNSVAVIPDKIIRDKFNKTLLRMHLVMTNIFGLIAFETAYRSDVKWLEQLLEYVNNNYLYVSNELRKNNSKINTFDLEGTYLMWLDFRNFPLSQKELTNKLVNEAKLGLSDGTIYGKDGAGFMRLNIGCPRSILEKAVKQLIQYF